MPTTELAPEANLTVLVGTLSRAPERRPLPSGDTVLSLEVSVHPDDGPAESVNVAWYGAPVAAERWLPGEQVLVTGRTRRRFFRVAGVTQSRTEVVATVALPTRRAAAARSALEAAAGEVLAALEA
jgi:single-stranded DNA-binding protein